MKDRTLVRGLGVILVLVVSAAPRPAGARLVDLHASGYAAGLTGWGTTTGTPDFFQRRQGGGFGAEVGVKLLIFDVKANFTQLLDTHGREGTLTQGLVGINIDLPVGNQVFQSGLDKGRSRMYLRPIFDVGLALGSPQPVHLPVDNAQISDKGIVSYTGLNYEYFLNEFMGVGAEADFGYHYFWGGGKSMLAANQDHSAGYQVLVLGALTFHLGY